MSEPESALQSSARWMRMHSICHLADGTCAGQVVMHAHLHVVPRSTDDSFHWNWRQLKYESDAVRDEIAEKMRRALKLNPDE